MAKKRIITISLEVVDFIGKSRRRTQSAYYDKNIISIAESLVYHQNTFRKMQNYLRKGIVCICFLRT